MAGATRRRRLAVLLTAAGLAAGSQVALTTGVAAAPRGVCIVSQGVTYSVRNTVVTGTAGFDTIDCRGARKGLTIYGMGGGDDIWGTKARDVIWGDHPSTPAGSCAAPNSVRVWAGAGDDTVHGSVCGATVEGEAGNDEIVSEGGWVALQGGAGADTLDARAASPIANTSGPAYAWGGPGDDHILAGAIGLDGRGDEGNDVLEGGAGDDLFEGGAGDDTLSGNGGNDSLVDYEGGIDHLSGGDGDDVLNDRSADSDFFDGGNNDTTTPPLPRPPAGTNGGWGDICVDADGYGTAPGDPDGLGGSGINGAIQNDTISGCEYLMVTPLA
jgi:Ca2+-binding RTX toxin-like protein